MKKITILAFAIMIFVACNNATQNTKNKEDSATADTITNIPGTGGSATMSLDTATFIKALNDYANTPAFKKEYIDEGNGSFAINEHVVLIGDLNNDQQADAIIPFIIEGYNRGNYYAIYYGVILHETSTPKVVDIITRGTKISGSEITLNSIEQNTAIGWEKHGLAGETHDSTRVSYKLVNNKLVKTSS